MVENWEAKHGKAGRIMDVMKLDERLTAAQISDRLGGDFSSHEVAGLISQHLVGKYLRREKMTGKSRKYYEYWRFW